MISKLYIDSTVISDMVRTSSPSFEGDNIVTTKLLNGKKIIQHIGELSQIIEVTCVMNATNKEIFDDSFKRVGIFTLKRYGLFYNGYISEYAPFELIRDSYNSDNRLYEATFVLNVEGDE